MTLSFVASGSGVGASDTASPFASVTPALPTGYAADDLLLSTLGLKPGPTDPNGGTAPTGWTIAATVSNGTTASGADSGSVRSRVDYKVATSATETAPTYTFAAQYNPLLTNTLVVRKTTAGAWTVQSTTGTQTTTGNVNVTGAATLGLKAGDWIIVHYVGPTDSPVITAPVISVPGCVVGAVTDRSANAQTTTGNDISAQVFQAQITSGTATGAPTFTATASTTAPGPNAGQCAVSFVRIAEPTASPAFSGSLALSGSGTLNAGGTPAPTAPIALAGEGTLTLSGTASTSGGGTVSAPVPLTSYQSSVSALSHGPVAVGSAVAVGTVVMVTVHGAGQNAGFGVSDSKGNTWTAVPASTTTTASTAFSTTQIFYTKLTSAWTASDTITVTRAASNGLTFFAATVPGASGVLDASASGEGATSPNGLISTSPVAAAAGSLTVMAATYNSGLNTWTPSTGWTIGQTGANTVTNIRSGGQTYRVSPSAETITPSVTIGTTNQPWSATSVVFAAAASGNAQTGTASFTADGTLALSGVPKPTAPLGLSGTGTLTLSGTPKPTGSVNFAGSGTQGSTGSPAPTGTRSFTGSGQVTLTGKPSVGGSSALSGSGSLALSGSGTTVATGSLALSGSGSVVVSGTVKVTGSISFSGNGATALEGNRFFRDITIHLTTPAFDWVAVVKAPEWDAEAISFEWAAVLLGQVWDAVLASFDWTTDVPALDWAASVSEFTWASGPPDFD